MRDEEKAKKYCQSHYLREGYAKRESFVRAMLAMAEWKNKQFAEEKEDLLGLVRMLPINETNQTIIEDLVGILSK